MVLVLLTSLNCCMSTLRLVYYALLLSSSFFLHLSTSALSPVFSCFKLNISPCSLSTVPFRQSSFLFFYDYANMTVEAAYRPSTHVNMRCIHPRKKEVPSRFKGFWFCLSWRKQHGQFKKQTAVIIRVVCYKLVAVGASSKNCSLADSFPRPMA